MSASPLVLLAARAALHDLVSTINSTGGVVRNYEGLLAPAIDEDWLDLGLAYEQACDVLGVAMLVSADKSKGGKE